MKVLTNIQSSYLGGIGRTFLSLVEGLNENKKREIEFVGIQVLADKNVSKEGIYHEKKVDNFRISSLKMKLPDLDKAIKSSKNVEGLVTAYSGLIEEYQRLISQQKPDLILINGTYYIPWCLFTAAKRTNLPIILHYHGIISKEVSHWAKKPRTLMEEMEKTFDNDRLFYFFPSNFAKETVEKEVFKHKICRSAIIPNPIPQHFFQTNKTKGSRNLGIVGRWSEIKNPLFVRTFARYNKDQKEKFDINLVTDVYKARKILKTKPPFVYLKKPMSTYRLAEFYSRMGVILSPSYFETYGNVAQEAIASGTPALISNKMGVAETFRSIGLDNLITDFDSVSSVYQKAEEVSMMVISQKTRRQLSEQLSSRKISQKIMKAFKQV